MRTPSRNLDCFLICTWTRLFGVNIQGFCSFLVLPRMRWMTRFSELVCLVVLTIVLRSIHQSLQTVRIPPSFGEHLVKLTNRFTYRWRRLVQQQSRIENESPCPKIPTTKLKVHQSCSGSICTPNINSRNKFNDPKFQLWNHPRLHRKEASYLRKLCHFAPPPLRGGGGAKWQSFVLKKQQTSPTIEKNRLQELSDLGILRIRSWCPRKCDSNMQ